MQVTNKIFTRAAANLFFESIFQRCSIFFFSFFCCFCIHGFFCLFVCLLKLKICVLLHSRLWGRVENKKHFTRPISGNKTTSFWHKVWNFATLSFTSFQNGSYLGEIQVNSLGIYVTDKSCNQTKKVHQKQLLTEVFWEIVVLETGCSVKWSVK